MADLYYKKGDRLPVIAAILAKASDDDSLTGYTMQIRIRDPGGNVALNSATIDDAALMEVSYALTATDTDENGEWRFQFVGTKGGLIRTWPPDPPPNDYFTYVVSEVLT